MMGFQSRRARMPSYLARAMAALWSSLAGNYKLRTLSMLIELVPGHGLTLPSRTSHGRIEFDSFNILLVL